jgi:predicted ester cyclase
MLALVHRLLAGRVNQRNLATMDELGDPSFQIEIAGLPPMQDVTLFRQVVASFPTALTQSRFTIGTLSDDGHLAVLRWAFQGIGAGHFGNIDVAGKPVTITGIVLSHYAPGHVTAVSQ